MASTDATSPPASTTSDSFDSDRTNRVAEVVDVLDSFGYASQQQMDGVYVALSAIFASEDVIHSIRPDVMDDLDAAIDVARVALGVRRLILHPDGDMPVVAWESDEEFWSRQREEQLTLRSEARCMSDAEGLQREEEREDEEELMEMAGVERVQLTERGAATAREAGYLVGNDGSVFVSRDR